MATELRTTARLWQLLSPTLPVGAYSYSQGLETAVEQGWVGDEDGAREWILGQLEWSLPRLDLPLLARLRRAWEDAEEAAVRALSRRLLASRGSAELQAEDRQLGQALARLLADLGHSAAADWARDADATFATLFALAGTVWGIGRRELLAGYAWTWCENQTAAAVKLVPLGQTAGQRLLLAAGERLEGAVERALALAEEDIGLTAPGLALAASLHETQYSRLFRS